MPKIIFYTRGVWSGPALFAEMSALATQAVTACPSNTLKQSVSWMGRNTSSANPDETPHNRGVWSGPALFAEMSYFSNISPFNLFEQSIP